MRVKLPFLVVCWAFILASAGCMPTNEPTGTSNADTSPPVTPSPDCPFLPCPNVDFCKHVIPTYYSFHGHVCRGCDTCVFDTPRPMVSDEPPLPSVS